MRVIVSAGGTGGHIYPALAIVRKIKEMEPSSTFLYIGTTDRMEKDIVPALDIPYVGIEMMGMNRKKIWKNGKSIRCFLKGINKTRELIKEFNPDVVLGIGGYITAPVIYAAHKEKVKTFIHEQNSMPGLSNRFLSRYVDKIGVSFEESITYFPKEKTVYTGNPRSEEITKVKKAKKQDFQLSEEKPLVLMVMGSLGSKTMTEKMKEMIPSFKRKEYEVIIVTGKNYYEEYRKVDVPDNVRVVPYLDNLIEVMKSSDLMISRAGASSIAELTSIGLPTIFVPSPYVTHNHQMKNAEVLKNKGASEIIEEQNFSKETLLPLIDTILNDKELYRKMKENTKKLGCKDSATKIYQVVKRLVEDTKHE